MPHWLQLFLMVLGTVFFFCAALGAPSHPRVNWGWSGCFCWALVFLIRAFGGG